MPEKNRKDHKTTSWKDSSIRFIKFHPISRIANLEGYTELVAIKF